MYKNILVPIAPDHNANTSRALDIAKRLRAEGGQITLLTVVEQIPAYVSQYLPEGQLDTNLSEAEASLAADASGIAGVKTVAISGHAGTTITEHAEKAEVDLIVIASHRPGLQDYFLGSTAARVVRHAPCAVHVVR